MRLPRNAQIWLPGMTRSWWTNRGILPAKYVWLVITDHYEPYWGRPSDAVANERVARWATGWPAIAARHRDAYGRPPRYCFFYPEEEYRSHLLDQLAEMAQHGIADVEVHLHHDGEGERDFRDRMTGFIATLRQRHGLLRDRDQRASFAFIHGNWALDNSHPEGRYCGLNNEITILQELGCYADFTMAAAPSPCQTRIVNQIYWAVDDPSRPRSHDSGRAVRPGAGIEPGLLMVQGPLTVRRHQRKRWMPSVETGELSRLDPPTAHRVNRWLAAAPRIGEHQFIKLHTHGAQEPILESLLGGGLDALFTLVAKACRARGSSLGFASAWECAGIINSLAVGEDWSQALRI